MHRVDEARVGAQNSSSGKWVVIHPVQQNMLSQGRSYLSGLYLHARMAPDLIFIAHLICCCVQPHAQTPEFVPSVSHILLKLLLTLTSTLKQADD